MNVPKTINMLYAPEGYWEATPAVRKAVCNGCGPGGWKVKLIPDTVWFLSIKESCNIHDWMYQYGCSDEDKKEADRVFKNNALRIVADAGGPWILQRLRNNRVQLYYESVEHFGGPSFWAGKNKPGTTALIGTTAREARLQEA